MESLTISPKFQIVIPMIQSMRRGAMALISLILLLVVAAVQPPAKIRYPGTLWDRAPSPESLGWSTEKLHVAKAYSATIHTAAVMIVVAKQRADRKAGSGRVPRNQSVRREGRA